MAGVLDPGHLEAENRSRPDERAQSVDPHREHVVFRKDAGRVEVHKRSRVPLVGPHRDLGDGRHLVRRCHGSSLGPPGSRGPQPSPGCSPRGGWARPGPRPSPERGPTDGGLYRPVLRVVPPGAKGAAVLEPMGTSNPRPVRSAFAPIASTGLIPFLMLWNGAPVSIFSHTRCPTQARLAVGPVVGAVTLIEALEVPKGRRPPGPGFTLFPEPVRRR